GAPGSGARRARAAPMSSSSTRQAASCRRAWSCWSTRRARPAPRTKPRRRETLDASCCRGRAGRSLRLLRLEIDDHDLLVEPVPEARAQAGDQHRTAEPAEAERSEEGDRVVVLRHRLEVTAADAELAQPVEPGADEPPPGADAARL